MRGCFATRGRGGWSAPRISDHYEGQASSRLEPGGEVSSTDVLDRRALR